VFLVRISWDSSVFRCRHVEFRERGDDGYRIKCIRNPSHCESISDIGDQFRSVLSLCRNAGVEILHGLSKPHPDDKERCDPDEESKESNPRRQPLHHRLLQYAREFATHLVAEGNHGERDEEED